MKIDSFNEYYDKVICYYINEIKNNDNYRCIKPVSRRAKSRVYRYYQNKRDELRRVYMKSSSQPLDRHKVASCMLYAILRAKVIRVNRWKADLPDFLLMANEHLAISIALNIVELYRFNDYAKMHDECVDMRHADNIEIVLPKTYHETAEDSTSFCTFMCNMCKSLYYVKKIKFFDVFAYANILFQLEKYTDTIIEIDELNIKS